MTDFFVSPTGNDNNDGSKKHPWLTANRAGNVPSGNTVYFNSGIYTPKNANDHFVMNIVNNGTPDNPTIFRSLENAKVAFRSFTTARRNFGIQINEKQYVQIFGISIHSAKRSGIRIINSSNIIIDKCNVYDIRELSASKSVSIPGIYLTGNSHNCVVKNNIVHNCPCGIKIGSESVQEIQNAIIEKNLIYDIHYFNEKGEIDDGNADGLQINTCRNCLISQNVIKQCGDDGIDCYKSYDCIIEKNTIFNIGDNVSNIANGSGGDGNGIKTGTGGGGGHLISRNICFNCERAGFDNDHVETSAPGCTFYNNIAYGCGRNGFYFDRPSNTPRIVKNNISFNNNKSNGNFTDIRAANNANLISDYNFWSDNHFISNQDVHSKFGDPQFSNPPLPYVFLNPSPVVESGVNFGKCNGFKLAPTSPCVNSGTNVGENFSGPAPDIGSYEFSNITITPRT